MHFGAPAGGEDGKGGGEGGGEGGGGASPTPAAPSAPSVPAKAALDQQPWLCYRWGAHRFRLPAPTCTCKIIDFGLSSMRVSGVRR